MKSNSLKRNFMFQLAYQVIIFVIPFVMSPYLTRKLGSKGLGEYSYIYSYISYVILIANLGINTYGQRVIASNRDNNDLLRKKFWSLYSVHVFFAGVSLALYFFLFPILAYGYEKMYIIQIIFIFSTLFDVTWLFYGLESFKNVVVKNGFVKILECVLIFLLVKRPEDIYVYACIIGGSTFLGQTIVFFQAVRFIKPIKFEFRDCKQHLKPLFILFSSAVAVTLYTVFDKTLLGLMSTKNDVAFYEYAEKIIAVPKMLINVIGMVIFPRACNAFAMGKYDEQKKYMDVSMFLTCLLGCAFMFGLMAVGTKFSVVYYGAGFEKCGNAIVYMTPLILIVLIGNIYRTEYMTPAKLDKELTFGIVISAVINIVLSYILIPKLGIFGAIIGTSFAEIFGLIYQTRYCIKIYTPKDLLRNLLPFFAVGIVMFVIIIFVDQSMDTSFKSLLFEVIIGAAIYLIGAILVINRFFPQYWNAAKGFIKNKCHM